LPLRLVNNKGYNKKAEDKTPKNEKTSIPNADTLIGKIWLLFSIFTSSIIKVMEKLEPPYFFNKNNEILIEELSLKEKSLKI
jgi:hypothetical protein